MGNAAGGAVTMIVIPIQDPGFRGLGNGHDRGAYAERNPRGEVLPQRAARRVSPDDNPPADNWNAAGLRDFENASDPIGAALDFEVSLSGRDLDSRLLEAREGAERARSTSPARLSGPAQFLNKLLDTWRLDHGHALALLGLEPPQRAYLDDLLTGYAPPAGRDIKDRIAYLFTIRKTLSALFPDETDENDWLREPHGPLQDREPMTLMLEGSMDNLLLVKEYVDAAAGL